MLGMLCGMIRVHISLTERLHKALKQEARRTGLMKAEIVRRALEAYLRRAGK